MYHFYCFPVECNKWYRYADEAPACLDDALVENRWATEEELAELDEEGKKKLLITSLALKLNPEKHAALGLALREVLVVLFSSVRSSCGYHGLIRTYPQPLFQIFQILQILK